MLVIIKAILYERTVALCARIEFGEGLGRSKPWGDSQWSRRRKEIMKTGIRFQNSLKKIRERSSVRKRGQKINFNWQGVVGSRLLLRTSCWFESAWGKASLRLYWVIKSLWLWKVVDGTLRPLTVVTCRRPRSNACERGGRSQKSSIEHAVDSCIAQFLRPSPRSHTFDRRRGQVSVAASPWYSAGLPIILQDKTRTVSWH